MYSRYLRLGGALLAAGSLASTVKPAFAEPDTVAPTGAITVPANKAALTALSSIRGTASDNVAVTKATLLLRRASDSKSWNGTEWVTAITGLNMSVIPGDGTNAQIVRSATLPQPGTDPNTQLVDGLYSSFAYLYDAANNRGITPNTLFYVDRTAPPSPLISNPLNGQPLNKLETIRGTAVDNEGGTGIERVAYAIRRLSDNLYWTGSAWGSAATYINATRLSGSATWTQTGALPAGDALANGSYIIYAYSYDRAGNRSAEPAKSSFVIDKIAPTLSFDNPLNGSTLKALTILRGPATDNSGVVRRAIVSLRRLSDNLYWNGSDWVSAITNLDASVADNTFRYFSSLPAGDDLQDGSYIALAYAYDSAGNRSVEPGKTVFTLDRVAPSAAVTEPANAATVTALASIKGTASDATSGVVKVNVAISRNGSSGLEAWAKRNGVYGWGTTTGDLPSAVLSVPGGKSTAWTASSELPSGANLAAGQYFVAAVALDKAGNRFVSSPNSFTVGTPISDTVKVLSPANGASVTALTAIEGNASDAQKVAQVGIAISRRTSTGGVEVWGNRDGVIGWGTTQPAPLLATLSAPGTTSTNFRLATNLPSGANLTPGTYFVAAQSVDGSGGTLASAINTFTVTGTTTTFAYAGKYNVSYVTVDDPGEPHTTGTFVLSVTNDGKASGSIAVPGLNRNTGEATFTASTSTFSINGEMQVEKTTDGDSYVGVYTGSERLDGDPAEDASDATLTVNSNGTVALHIVDPDGEINDFSGTVNLTTGAFTIKGVDPDGANLNLTGQLERHNGIITVTGTVSASGVLSGELANDHPDIDDDTMTGDLDSVSASPMKGSGVITDIHTDGTPNEPGATWTSQKQ